MSIRIPALLALLLVACTAHDGPTPITPTAPVTPTPPTNTPDPSTAPVVIAAPPPPIIDPPIASPDPPPLRTPPPAPDSPAAITLAIASVQITRDCPDEPSGERNADEASITQHEAEKQSRKTNGCEQSTLQLSLQNTGGRAGKLEIKTVRVLDGASKRVLATLPSRKPSRWLANGYQPWDEQVPGNALTQATYRLGEPAWKDGGVHSLEFQPYFVEIVATIDGRKQTVRSAEIVPRSMDMVET